MIMCSSSACQHQVSIMDKENCDWNNNSSSMDVSMSSSCQCTLNRRTRRRHPATIQTPGRLEVGEVLLEPLVSNRLDESRLERDWNLNYYKAGSNQHNLGSNQLSAGSNIYLNPLQSFQSKQQRFDFLGEWGAGNNWGASAGTNWGASAGNNWGAGANAGNNWSSAAAANTEGGWKQNLSSSKLT